MSITQLTDERRSLGLTDAGDPPDLAPAEEGTEHAPSIADRADGYDPTEQEELFVLEQGRKVTLAQLLGRNTPIEYRFNLNSKGLKGGGDMGLVAFTQPELTLVVPVRAGKVVVDPTYAADGSVEKVRVTAHFKPTTAYDSRSSEARAALGLE